MIENIETNIVLFSKIEPFRKKSPFKDFIGYDDNDDIRPL